MGACKVASHARRQAQLGHAMPEAAAGASGMPRSCHARLAGGWGLAAPWWRLASGTGSGPAPPEQNGARQGGLHVTHRE